MAVKVRAVSRKKKLNFLLKSQEKKKRIYDQDTRRNKDNRAWRKSVRFTTSFEPENPLALACPQFALDRQVFHLLKKVRCHLSFR